MLHPDRIYLECMNGDTHTHPPVLFRAPVSPVVQQIAVQAALFTHTADRVQGEMGQFVRDIRAGDG